MQLQLQDLWKHVVERARRDFGSTTLDMLLENAEPVKLESGTLTLRFLTNWERDWVEARHLDDLRTMCRELVPGIVDIELITASDNGSAVASPPPSSTGAGGDASPSRPAPGLLRSRAPARVSGGTLNPRYTFDSFVVGPSNRFAQAAALAVAEDPAGAYNPLFLYGGVGLGKTHLMQAIAHYVREHHRRMLVVYVSSETFTNELINALAKRSMAEFRQKYRNVDVLLIDDIQFVAGKEQTQEEFFHTFNALHDANKQIIISSDRPPKEIPTLEDRLRSRFEWGLITDVQPPDLETRIAILRKKAIADNLDVPSEVLAFIADRVDTNIRELEGALIRVVAYSALLNQPITPDLALEALKDIMPDSKPRMLSIHIIQQTVCDYYRLRIEDLKSKKRTKSVAFPRQIAMYLCREMTEFSLPKIGEDFGGRDHTTVIHAHEKISRMIEEDPQVKEVIKQLKQQLQRKA